VATFCRYTKIAATPWAEELSRYLMIWLTFIGIGLVAKEGSHFSVDVLVEHCPVKIRKFFYVLQMLIVDGFCLFVAYNGLHIVMAQMAMGQTSPALQVLIWMISLVIPLGTLLMLFQYTIHHIGKIKSLAVPADTVADKGGNV
jgi:C4-dicarboxylate transporter DctQ subunit